MALIQASNPLSSALRETLPERPFHVRFWDGGVVQATSSGAPTFFVRRPSALSHFLRAPGTLGLGRAYVDGSLDVDDLDGAFIVVDDWEPPPLSVKDRARLGLGIALAALPGGLPHRPSLELILRGERHSLQRDAAAVRYHYDVGNDFFALFLDESMTYSCAIYSRGAQTLRGGAAHETGARREQARSEAGYAPAGRRLRVGQLRDPRGEEPRRHGHRRNALAVSGGARARAGRRGGSRASRWRSGWPTTASCREHRTTRS